MNPPGAIPLKAIATGKIEVSGQTFYPILFPCVESFAEVPSATIPQALDLMTIDLPSLDGLEACQGSFAPIAGSRAAAPLAGGIGIAVLGLGLTVLGLRRLRS